MVILLQDVLCLVDEDCRALQALPAVSDLLGELPQLHHLREEQREAQALRSQCVTSKALRKPLPKPGAAQGKQGVVKQHRNVPKGSEERDHQGTFSVKFCLQVGKPRGKASMLL